MKRKQIFKFSVTLLLLLGVLFLSEKSRADTLELNIWNGTFSKPGKVDELKLFDLSRKMALIKESNNVSGSIRITNIDPAKKLLLKTIYQKVTYLQFIKLSNHNKDVFFKDPDAARRQSKKKWQVRVAVYENYKYKSFQKAGIHFHIEHIVLRKTLQGLEVEQSIHIINNTTRSGKTAMKKNFAHPVVQPGAVTLSLANGIDFSLPGVKENRVQSQALYNSIPEHSEFVYKKKNIFSFRGSLKPGITELQVSYLVQGEDVNIKFPFSSKKISLYLFPHDARIKFSISKDKKKINSLSLTKKIRKDVQQNYILYEIKELSKNSLFSMNVTGGTLRKEHTHNEGRRIVKKPFLAKYQWIILIPVFLLILIKIYYFDQSNKDENLSLQDLIRQMAQLDFIKGQGKIDLNAYRLQYSELESQAVNLLLKESPINKKE